MSNTCNIIKIEDIENSPNKQLKVVFKDFIEDIDSKDPICAKLSITSMGEFINIIGNVYGSVFLECDLCLESFEYKFNFDVDEVYVKGSLNADFKQDIEIKDGQFVTDLKRSDSIDISDFLYQSVILDFPNKKVCGINCKGGDIFIRDEKLCPQKTDPRMDVFKNINIKT